MEEERLRAFFESCELTKADESKRLSLIIILAYL